MTQQVITRLEAMPKQGASYDQKGRHGWRNPKNCPQFKGTKNMSEYDLFYFYRNISFIGVVWGWVKVWFRNFFHTTLGFKKGKLYCIVFWKTGHCLHFDNPWCLDRMYGNY